MLSIMLKNELWLWRREIAEKYTRQEKDLEKHFRDDYIYYPRGSDIFFADIIVYIIPSSKDKLEKQHGFNVKLNFSSRPTL